MTTSTAKGMQANIFKQAPLVMLAVLTTALSVWPAFSARSIEITLVDLPVLIALIWFGPRKALGLTVLGAAVGWFVWGSIQPNAWLTLHLNTLLLLGLITLVRNSFDSLSTAVCGLAYWLLLGVPVCYLIVAIGFGDIDVALVLTGQRVFSGVAALIGANAIHFLALSNQRRIPKAWLNGKDHIDFSLREVTETAALLGAATPILLLIWFLVTEQLEKEIDALLAQSDARFETLAQGADRTLADLDTAAELIAATLEQAITDEETRRAELESQLKVDLNATSAVGFAVFRNGVLSLLSPGAQAWRGNSNDLPPTVSPSGQRLVPLSADDEGPQLYQIGSSDRLRVGLIFDSPLALWQFMYGRGLSAIANTGSGGGMIERISHFHGPSDHELFGIETGATITRQEYDYAIWIPASRRSFADGQFRTIAQFRNSYITFMASDTLIESFDNRLFDIDCFRFTTDFWTHMRDTLNAMALWIIGGTAGLLLLAILMGQAINFFIKPFSQLTSAMTRLSALDDTQDQPLFEFDNESGSHEFRTLSEGFSQMETDLRRSASRLIDINHSYETLLNQVEVGFLSVDKAGRQAYQNPVMGRLLQRFSDLEERLLHLKPEDAGLLEPLAIHNTAGEKLNALIHVVPRIDLRGDVDGSWILLTDVTSLRSAEEKVVRSQRLATLGQMATGMAHEINQPLQSIRLTLANLKRLLGREASDPEPALKKTDQIDEQVARIAGLVEHMKSYGRIDPSQWQDFSADQTITSVIKAWAKSFETQGIHLETALAAGDDTLIPGSGSQFEEVILNLLSNARDAYRESGRTGAIRISSSLASGIYTLDVEDDAGGVAPEHLNRIFDPFFTTKAPNKGAGLGLSASYGIIDDMGGQITVANSASGARFTIRLPLIAQA